MKKKLFLILYCMIISSAFAVETDWQEFMLNHQIPVFALNTAPSPDDNAAVVNLTPKSIKKALFLSAVVPGAGQAYNDSWYKAAGFIAVEAVSWAVWIKYRGDGKDIENQFHDYANTHWIESDYWDWISRNSGLDRNNMDALREWEHDSYSHGLHEVKDQQYYEMIGKYDQFNYGWDDSDIAIGDEGWSKSLRSTKRLYYEGLRDDSNNAYKKATTGMTVVMFNHIISALEAAWSAKNQNQRLQTTLRFEPKELNNQQYSALTLRFNW